MKLFPIAKIALGLSVIVLLISACEPTYRNQANPDEINRIVKWLKLVRFNKHVNYLTLILAREMQKPDHSKIDDKTIDNIASLLAIPYCSFEESRAECKRKASAEPLTRDLRLAIFNMEDQIRSAGAIALGQIGPRAERTIPALDKALVEVRTIEKKYLHRTGRDSSENICTAFYQIGGEEERDNHDCNRQ